MNAPSLHVVEGVVMACWWRIPPLAASPVDRLGFGGGETVAATNPITEPLIPPPLYRAARRGPTSLILGWASPIRTRVKIGPVVGLARWRSILTSRGRLRLVSRRCLCPGVSTPCILEHHTLGGTPLVSSRAPIKPFIYCWSKMVAHQFRLVITCVHTNILPLDHQAKLISPLFNKMTHQDKKITMVNHTYH